MRRNRVTIGAERQSRFGLAALPGAIAARSTPAVRRRIVPVFPGYVGPLGKGGYIGGLSPDPRSAESLPADPCTDCD